MRIGRAERSKGGETGASRRWMALGLAAAFAVAACGNSDVSIYPGPDATPQSIVLSVKADDDTRATLAWSSAGDKLAYRIDRNGAAIGTTYDLGWTDAGLAAGKRYCWRVLAYGGFGWQARSNEVCLGTEPDTTGWRLETVASGRWPAVAVDASGGVHVCLAGANLGIAYVRVGPGSGAETVDVDGSGQCSIAIGADGVVQIAYLSRFGLRHARRVDGRWSASTVDVEALPGATRVDGPSLALSAAGLARIAYRRIANGAVSLAVASRDDVGWRFDLTGIPGLVGPRSLAIDADGQPWIAANDALGQSNTVWRRVSGGWAIAQAISLAPNRGEGPPLGFDAAGAPQTAWWQRDTVSTSAPITLRWAASTASGWRTETVARLTGLGTRVALVPDAAVPRIAVVDDTGSLRIFTRDAGNWSVEALVPQGGAAVAVDLAFGPDGQLRLVFDRVVEGSVVLASRKP
jgi:hypothetical protein